MIAALPLTLLTLLAYNAVVFGLGPESLLNIIGAVQLPSMGGTDLKWVISLSDLLVLGGLFALYIEVAKATRTSNVSIIDHGMSFVAFVIYLLEFLLVKQAGNSTFFLLLAISCVDVLAGFTVSITGARRDWGAPHG